MNFVFANPWMRLNFSKYSVWITTPVQIYEQDGFPKSLDNRPLFLSVRFLWKKKKKIIFNPFDK